jgi:ubiquinone/menaquinone biosynthesis C-methylase UbiE
MRACGERKPEYSIPLPAKLVEVLKCEPTPSVLDVGCGYGRACFYLCEKGFRVIGVDVDKTQLKLAQKAAGSQSIGNRPDFLVNDAGSLCFPDSSFDAVAMLGVLTLVSKVDRVKMVSEAHRVVKIAGYLFIEEFGRSWTNPVYSKRYREDFRITGEVGTFIVKDRTGRALHFAHHFTRPELHGLLRRFSLVTFEEGVFTSYCQGNTAKGYLILAQKRDG